MVDDNHSQKIQNLVGLLVNVQIQPLVIYLCQRFWKSERVVEHFRTNGIWKPLWKPLWKQFETFGYYNVNCSGDSNRKYVKSKNILHRIYFGIDFGGVASFQEWNFRNVSATQVICRLFLYILCIVLACWQ